MMDVFRKYDEFDLHLFECFTVSKALWIVTTEVWVAANSMVDLSFIYISNTLTMVGMHAALVNPCYPLR